MHHAFVPARRGAVGRVDDLGRRGRLTTRDDRMAATATTGDDRRLVHRLFVANARSESVPRNGPGRASLVPWPGATLWWMGRPESAAGGVSAAAAEGGVPAPKQDTGRFCGLRGSNAARWWIVFGIGAEGGVSALKQDTGAVLWSAWLQCGAMVDRVRMPLGLSPLSPLLPVC